MIGNEAATVGSQNVTGIPRTGLRRVAFRGYRWLLAGFLLLGVAQIFLAGLGAFTVTTGPAVPTAPSPRTARSGSRWVASRC